MSRINVLGVEIDNLTRQKALERALSLIDEHRSAYMVTPNPEIVMAAWDSDEVSAAINNADLVIPDGIGVMKAAEILRTPLAEHLPGIDVATELLERLAKDGKSVFLFGAKPGVAEKAAEKMAKQFPGLVICGTNDGYADDDEAVVAKINAAKPDFLIVCLGVPKQELWMARNAAKLDVGLMAGLGGTLDVFSGEVKRAPASWQRLHLEWLYRCLEEPKRFKKIKKLPLFILKAWRERTGNSNDEKR